MVVHLENRNCANLVPSELSVKIEPFHILPGHIGRKSPVRISHSVTVGIDAAQCLLRMINILLRRRDVEIEERRKLQSFNNIDTELGIRFDIDAFLCIVILIPGWNTVVRELLHTPVIERRIPYLVIEPVGSVTVVWVEDRRN